MILQCEYTIEHQRNLFRSIKPLFANKQLIIVVNKVDFTSWDDLEEGKEYFAKLFSRESHLHSYDYAQYLKKGVLEVKATACNKLLAARVDSRLSTKKFDGIMNRIQVFYPKPRDNKV